jgi:hypothetical protein
MSFFAEQAMDLAGCTQTCKDYCQPAVDLLLQQGEITLYVTLLLSGIIVILAWQLWQYKKLYYKAVKE